MKTDYWENDEIQKNVAEILKAELDGLVSENRINELIQICGTDMSLMEKYVAKYALKIEIDEDFNFDELKIIIGNKFEINDVFKVLKYLSLFEHIGYKEHKETQLHILNKNLIKLPYNNLQQIIELLINKKLISSKGYFIWLEKYKNYFFEKWITTFDGSEINNLINTLEESETFAAFGLNIVNLSNKVEPTIFISQFTKENGLLRNYDFVNSELGSNLALNFVETESKKDVINAIKEALNSKTIDELKDGFNSGRRNCIWLLEKLCYFQETAVDSIKLMYRLALAENEHLANNASTQFAGYFQPFLAATILSFEERLRVLVELEDEYGINQILVFAYDRILKVDHYIGNIITFGTRKEEHEAYDSVHRITDEELNLYFNTALIKLTCIAVDNESPFNEISKTILSKRFFGQYTKRKSNKALASALLIIRKEGVLNSKWRQIFETIVFEKREISPYKLKLLKIILDKYKAQNVEQELDFKVINAPYKSEKNDNGWTDISKEEAINLAKKYIRTKNTEWINYLDKLLTNDQRQTYAFGQTIGENHPNTIELLELCIETALNILPKNLNNSLIIGLIDGKSDFDFTRQAIDRVISEDKLIYIGLRFTRFLESDLQIDDLIKLIPIFNKNSNMLVAIEYLDITNLSNDEIISFINELKEIDDVGYSFSLELLWDLFRKSNERWVQLKSYTRQILYKNGIFNFKSFMGGTSLHVEDLIKMLSNDNITEKEIEFFINEILKGYEEFFGSNETILNIMIFHFLEKHFDISWPIIGDALLDNNYNGSYYLKNISKHFKFEEKKLLKWAETKLPYAPSLLMEFIPFEVKEDDNIGWSILALELINLYGNDDKLLSSLASRLQNYFVNGSAVPLYESRKKMLELLLEHSNEKVVNFANKQIHRINIRIQEQKDFDANYDLGEF